MERENRHRQAARIIFLGQLCLAGILLSGCTLPVEPPPSPSPIPPTATAHGSTSTPQSVPTISATSTATQPVGPSGKIAWTCQVSRQQLHDQICMGNADGTGFRQLTEDPDSEAYYPSWAPDGRSLVYASNRSGQYEIYEL